jgi:hypothetical protein
MELTMRKVLLISLGISILLLAGCSKSPMDKLASDTIYSDMNNTFWGKEQDNHTQLWEQALTYCKQNNQKPNCQPVLLVSTINNGNTKLIPLNSHPLKN